MIRLSSNSEQLISQIRWLKYFVPLALAIFVVFYQLGVAQTLEQSFGHLAHYSFEIAFYSLTGPIASWLMLSWVERNLREKANIERVAQRLNQERADMIAEERERIARDLHDEVAQTLYFVALKADMAGQLIAQQPDRVFDALKEIGDGTRRVIRDVRLTIFALQPPAWNDGDFLEGLRKFTLAFAEQAGWQLELNLPDDEATIPIPLQSTLFRLINESLVNVAKHANAGRVVVDLRPLAQAGGLQLSILDDGCGFTSDEKYSAGIGLAQLRSRVAVLNGEFDLKSAVGQGTEIHIKLPLLEEWS